MYASIQYNVGVALVTVGLGLMICTLLIGVIEAMVLFFLKWDKFVKCLWVSLLINIMTTIFGIGGAMVGSFGYSTNTSVWVAVIIAFVLSVFIEGLLLMLMKHGETRQNWFVSLIANSVSYLLIIMPLAWRIAW